jgi:hypothetical protein
MRVKGRGGVMTVRRREPASKWKPREERRRRLTMRFRIIAVLAMLAIAFPPGGAALADDDGPEVDRHGTCSMGARWELDVEKEGSYLNVDFEIKTATAGRDWRIVLKHDGNVFFNGVRATEHDGDVEVERRVNDHSGLDTIAARGTSVKNGQVCKGSLSI